MSAANPPRPLDPAVVVAREKEDVLVGNEIVRHKLSSRIIHWSVAVTFFVCLFTGMPIWTPLFGWMAALFGGLSVCRVLHPWVGLAFFVAAVVMTVDWASQMTPRPDAEGLVGTDGSSATCAGSSRTRTPASTTKARSSISGRSASAPSASSFRVW